LKKTQIVPLPDAATLNCKVVQIFVTVGEWLNIIKLPELLVESTALRPVTLAYAKELVTVTPELY
jgi:hypothetical protein